MRNYCISVQEILAGGRDQGTEVRHQQSQAINTILKIIVAGTATCRLQRKSPKEFQKSFLAGKGLSSPDLHRTGFLGVIIRGGHSDKGSTNCNEQQKISRISGAIPSSDKMCGIPRFLSRSSAEFNRIPLENGGPKLP
jgi:hypothetical protein